MNEYSHTSRNEPNEPTVHHKNQEMSGIMNGTKNNQEIQPKGVQDHGNTSLERGNQTDHGGHNVHVDHKDHMEQGNSTDYSGHGNNGREGHDDSGHKSLNHTKHRGQDHISHKGHDKGGHHRQWNIKRIFLRS